MKRQMILNLTLLPAALTVFYVIPASITSIAYNDRITFIIFALSVISVTMILTFSTILQFALREKYADTNLRRLIIFAKAILLLFFSSYLVLAVDFGGFPATKFFTEGGNPAILRAEFTKNKEGLANIAIYARSIVLKSLLPIAILLLIEQRQTTWFRWSLIAFSAISVLTYEKAIVIWVGIPLALFYFLSRERKKMFLSLAWTISVLLFTTAVQVGTSATLLSHSSTNGDFEKKIFQTNTVARGKTGEEYLLPVRITQARKPVQNGFDSGTGVRVYQANLSNTDNYRFILENNANETPLIISILGKLANRALWVPYITAYDAIAFWGEEYNEKLIFFSINRHLSKITDSKFSDIERELFRYQFGGNFDSTGNANFVFFVEAYIAFGLIGVFVYNLLIGSFIGLIGGTRSNVIIAAGFAPIFSFLNASFISSLFSGGVFFFAILVIFAPKWRRKTC